MKSKGEKIALISAIIIILVVVATIITGIVFGVRFIVKKAMEVKEAIEPDKFVAVMKDEGFEVKEITNTFGSNAKKIYKADNGKYSIEYYNFNNNSDADCFFVSVQSELKTKSATKEVSISGRNYSSYTLVKSGAYYFVERVDNTVVIVQGSSSHEDSSKKLLKNMGY